MKQVKGKRLRRCPKGVECGLIKDAERGGCE